MIVEFSIRHTKSGVTATMKTPKGLQNKRFVHTCYGDAMSKAEAWIREQRDGYIEHAKVEGKESPEFAIPDGLDKSCQTRRVTLNTSAWAELDAQAEREAISVSQLIAKKIAPFLAKLDGTSLPGTNLLTEIDQ
jgi:hypothetical protein